MTIENHEQLTNLHMVIGTIFFAYQFLMIFSLSFGWETIQRWQIFILASVIPIFAFTFFWFAFPEELWQRTSGVSKNPVFLAETLLLLILFSAGSAAVADYLSLSYFDLNFIAYFAGLWFPYQYIYYLWLTGSVFSMSVLLWVVFSLGKTEPCYQTFRSLFTLWSDVWILLLWMSTLLEMWIPRIQVLSWLWIFMITMDLGAAIILVLWLKERFNKVRKIFRYVRIFLGGFSLLAFYRFWDNIQGYMVQRSEYNALPTIFFSFIIISFAISAGIVTGSHPKPKSQPAQDARHEHL